MCLQLKFQPKRLNNKNININKEIKSFDVT